MKVSNVILVAGIAVLAIIGPWISPNEYLAADFDNILRSPTLAAGHVFGTDQLGRDLFVRTMMGVQVTFVVAIVASVVSLVIAQKPYDMGYLGVAFAMADAAGVTSLPPHVTTGFAIIDADNVDDPEIGVTQLALDSMTDGVALDDGKPAVDLDVDVDDGRHAGAQSYHFFVDGHDGRVHLDVGAVPFAGIGQDREEGARIWNLPRPDVLESVRQGIKAWDKSFSRWARHAFQSR